MLVDAPITFEVRGRDHEILVANGEKRRAISHADGRGLVEMKPERFLAFRAVDPSAHMPSPAELSRGLK